MRLPITVQDKKKQFVSGLTQGDFLILEDKIPQTIDSFTSEENNNLPLYVAVLMDTSPSTAAKMKFQQESAMNFIQTVVRPRRDRVLFATFDHEVTLRQDFTDRLELLDKAVYAVKKTGEQDRAVGRHLAVLRSENALSAGAARDCRHHRRHRYLQPRGSQ